MAKDKQDLINHGLKAAKANAKDSDEQQYVEELSTELTGSTNNEENENQRSPKK